MKRYTVQLGNWEGDTGLLVDRALEVFYGCCNRAQTWACVWKGVVTVW